MLQTELFTKTRKEAPKDEVARNAELLIRAGYIHKEIAGVYSILPLGLRVLRNIENIVREEMDAIGGQEISLTALQDSEPWKKTKLWDDKIVDNWFKTRLKNDTELGLAYTHESAIANLMKDYISSYRDLPSYPYQFQVKFRNELRAKSGIFRGREFLMKDMYSFSSTQEELDHFYEKAITAYKKIFERLGIGGITYMTLASGEKFGTKFSHEFQTVTSAGEDVIYIHKEKGIAINKEVLNDETLQTLGINRSELVEEKSIEVGNIYKLGTFYSEPLGLSYKNAVGELKPVIMGSYGIGITRLIGVLAEILSDNNGLIWPKNVAPFDAHLIPLFGSTDSSEKIRTEADKIYKRLESTGQQVLIDNREAAPGIKFSDADLIGIPRRIVISDKTLAQDSVEVKERTETSGRLVKIKDL